MPSAHRLDSAFPPHSFYFLWLRSHVLTNGKNAALKLRSANVARTQDDAPPLNATFKGPDQLSWTRVLPDPLRFDDLSSRSADWRGQKSWLLNEQDASTSSPWIAIEAGHANRRTTDSGAR